MPNSILASTERICSPSEEVTMQLRCPICGAKTRGSECMLQHLVAEHEVGKRQAKFLAHKLVEWRRQGSDFIIFLQNRQKAQTCYSGVPTNQYPTIAIGSRCTEP